MVSNMDVGELVKHPKVFVIGSTGTGKSAAAVSICRELQKHTYNPVIINVDVTQFFDCGLNVATNKVLSSEVLGIDEKPIPHAFLSFLDPIKGGDYNIHTFVEDVEKFISQKSDEDPRAAFVMCGGSNYYLQSILVEHELESEDEDESTDPMSLTGADPGVSLWEQLKAVDQESANKYHPNDLRRIRRCLEIFNAKGIPASRLREERPPAELRFSPSTVLWVDLSDHAALKARLTERLQVMQSRGIVDEALTFARKYVDQLGLGRKRDAGEVDKHSLPSCVFGAIGVKEFTSRMEVVRHDGEESPTISISLDNVNAGMEEATRKTVRYALQQQQWIRNRIVGKYSRLLDHGVFRLGVDEFREEAKSQSLSKSLSEFVLWLIRHPARSAEGPPGMQILRASQEPHARARSATARCDLCDRVICGASQWEAHLKSKGHLGALRHDKLVEEQRKLGREIPPRKRRRQQ